MGLKNLIKRKKNPEYYFFSGKGGVGKTSIAAATALSFSKIGKKVLIISTDPAHSLSDSFDKNIGGEIKKLGKNLFAVEIDPQKAMAEYKERLMPQLEKFEQLKGLGLENTFDMASMSPGIDEVAAFEKFLHYMHSKEYDVIIFDTAPTGHALRFLSLPQALDSWVGKMIKLRMKFSGIVNMVKKFLPFGEEKKEEDFGVKQLDDMKERIEEAKKILSNPEKTHFWLVSIAEMMSIFETERAIKTLGSYDIKVSGVIVNQLIEKPGCDFCKSRKKMQDKNLKQVYEKFKNMKIKKIPLFKGEIRGFKSLEKLGNLVFDPKSMGK